MAFVTNQGTKIYWDEQGQGPPLLLIMGLGASSVFWWRVRPNLAARYRTLALDNRGAGQSEVPPGSYSMPLMASDAAAVLDSAGIPRAHIFGLSMGGMIAQEFALQYPQRVLSLILGCTAAGGPTAVRADAEATKLLTSRASMSPEEAEIAFIPILYDPATPRARIDEDLEKRRAWYPTPEGYTAQLQAILGWQSFDRLVPAGNGERIASRIPGARLVLLDAANHMFITDQPEASVSAVLQFLDAHARSAVQT